MLFVSEFPKEAKGKILYAGLLLFTKKGYKNTSVLDVVELAKVSKTTFYQYYSMKEDLMSELLEVLANELIEEVKKAIEEENRVAYKAYEGIRRYIEICFTENQVASLILVESVGISQEVENIRSNAHRQFADIIFLTVQGLLPSSVSEQEMCFVSQAMVGAINEVVVQNYSESNQNLIIYDDLARLLNRIVIGAFVNLSL